MGRENAVRITQWLCGFRILVSLNQQSQAFDANTMLALSKTAKCYPQRVCKIQRQQQSKGRNNYPKFTETTFAFQEPRLHVSLSTCWRNHADTGCVTRLKRSHRNCYIFMISGHCQLSLPVPWEGSCHSATHCWAENTSGTPKSSDYKANVQTLQIPGFFIPSSKSLRSEYPATRFYCSLLMFQFWLLSFTACFKFCAALQHWGWKDYCSRLRLFQWLCCASSYQILLWTQDLMKFSLSLCCLVFQLFFLNFQRVQKLK